MTYLAGPDTFSGTPGTELSAYDPAWVRHPLRARLAVIAGGGRARSDTGGYALYYRNLALPAEGAWLECTAYCVSSSLYSGLAACVQTSALTYYRALQHSGSVILARVVAGVATQLGTSYPRAIAAGQSLPLGLRLDRAGASARLRVYGDPAAAPLIDYTDAAALPDGPAGLYVQATETTNIHLDDWAARTLYGYAEAEGAAAGAGSASGEARIVAPGLAQGAGAGSASGEARIVAPGLAQAQGGGLAAARGMAAAPATPLAGLRIEARQRELRITARQRELRITARQRELRVAARVA